MRPRLSSQVKARRHRVGADGFVVLHRGEAVVQLGLREWTVLQRMDGTRDAEGIVLAARQAGVAVSVAHVESFVESLRKAGMLDGPAAETEVAPAADRPIALLPGAARFACDGGGACCRSFPTILFRPLEVARARVTLPVLEEGVGESFLPESGLDTHVFAVAAQDGACLFYDGRGCGLHAVGGADAKPSGCRLFPMTAVDTGREIRVAVKPACRCAFTSAHDPGAPLVTEARRGRELDPDLFVPALPARVRLGARDGTTEELVALGDAIIRRLDEDPGADPLVVAWAAAHTLDGTDVSLEDAVRAAQARLSAFVRRNQWRAPEDLARQTAERLAASASVTPAPIRDLEGERMVLRIAAFLAGFGDDVAEGLREQAVRLHFARVWPADDDAHPLAAVEAFAHGHGVI